MIKSATVVPMLSTKWQETLNDDDKYQYDGRFVGNPRVLGRWEVIHAVNKIEDFTADPKTWKGPGRVDGRMSQLQKGITFKADGLTDDMLRIWSGDALMDLRVNAALKMTVKQIDDTDYLFIEKGGFDPRSPKGWKPPFYVLKRVAEK